MHWGLFFSGHVNINLWFTLHLEVLLLFSLTHPFSHIHKVPTVVETMKVTLFLHVTRISADPVSAFLAKHDRQREKKLALPRKVKYWGLQRNWSLWVELVETNRTGTVIMPSERKCFKTCLLVNKQEMEDFSGTWPQHHEEQIHKSAEEKQLPNTAALLHKMMAHTEAVQSVTWLCNDILF